MQTEVNEFGFLYQGIQYYTVMPRVYRIASPAIDEVGMGQFLNDFSLEPRADQLNGADPDVVIEHGGRLCYLSHGTGRSHQENIENMRNQNHGSVFRHGMLTLNIAGVSRGLTHELVRHGVGTAVSQVSSRYVDARRLGFVVPWEVREFPDMVLSFVTRCDQSLHEYESWVTSLMASGLDRKTARGCSRELLPIGLAQLLQMSFTCQSARHLLRMRGNPAADVQIRALAIAMAPIVKDTWPVACSDIELAPEKDLKLGVRLDDRV